MSNNLIAAIIISEIVMIAIVMLAIVTTAIGLYILVRRIRNRYTPICKRCAIKAIYVQGNGFVFLSMPSMLFQIGEEMSLIITQPYDNKYSQNSDKECAICEIFFPVELTALMLHEGELKTICGRCAADKYGSREGSFAHVVLRKTLDFLIPKIPDEEPDHLENKG